MTLKTKKRYRFKLPTAITILFFIIALVIIISWIPGTTKTWDVKDGDDIIKKGGPAGILDLFLAPMNGFMSKIDTIIFILVLGGFLNIVIKSEALDAGIGRLVLKMKGKEIWLIPILMTLFSIGGTTYGMGEETIALYPVLIPVMLAAGFDMLTSIMTILVGAGIGCLGSILNPFVIAVSLPGKAANNFDVTMSDGIVWRTVAWVIFTVVSILFVTWYAKRVKKNPQKSPAYNERQFYMEQFGIPDNLPEFNRKRKWILGIFGVTFVAMIACLIDYDSLFNTNIMENANDYLRYKFPWFASRYDAFGAFSLISVAAIFLISSIVISAIDWKGEENYVSAFTQGSADILSVCLVIATAAGIGWVLKETGMQDQLVSSLEGVMKKLGTTGFIIIGYIFFLAISVVIPSTSGFASAVMPTLGPVSEGVHPGLWSGTITTFSFANGLINLISPTSFILMAALSISKVSYDKYVKVSWPLILGIGALSIILLSIGTLLPISNGGAWF